MRSKRPFPASTNSKSEFKTVQFEKNSAMENLIEQRDLWGIKEPKTFATHEILYSNILNALSFPRFVQLLDFEIIQKLLYIHIIHKIIGSISFDFRCNQRSVARSNRRRKLLFFFLFIGIMFFNLLASIMFKAVL